MEQNVQTCSRTLAATDRQYMHLAYEQALKSYREGGIPVGAIMVEGDRVIAAGHNRRVQDDDPLAHGEIDCIRKCGRRTRYGGVTLYTTLSPCMMCAGTIIQLGISRVVVGENRNYKGYAQLLIDCGVGVEVLDDDACRELMAEFIDRNPGLWDEDVSGKV